MPTPLATPQRSSPNISPARPAGSPGPRPRAPSAAPPPAVSPDGMPPASRHSSPPQIHVGRTPSARALRTLPVGRVGNPRPIGNRPFQVRRPLPAGDSSELLPERPLEVRFRAPETRYSGTVLTVCLRQRGLLVQNIGQQHRLLSIPIGDHPQLLALRLLLERLCREQRASLHQFPVAGGDVQLNLLPGISRGQIGLPAGRLQLCNLVFLLSEIIRLPFKNESSAADVGRQQAEIGHREIGNLQAQIRPVLGA